MKKIALISALVLSNALVFSAVAQTSRAEVKAEAASAVKSGAIPHGRVTKEPKAKSTADRAGVKAEAAAAEKSGTIAKGEASTSAPKTTSVKSRAEVKAEAKDAVKKGEIAKGETTK